MRPLLLAALVLAAFPAAAQSPVVLDLPAPSLVEADVSVTRVIDLRADTASVGEAKVGLFNRRRPVVLEGGTAAAVRAYLRAALPPAPGRTPLVAGIDVLLVSEQTTATTEFGRAEVRLRFFEEQREGLAEVGAGHAFAEGTGLDVTRGHTGRLATVLDRAVVEFLQVYRADAPAPPPVPEAEVTPSTGALASEAAVTFTEAAARSLRTFVTVGPIVGANAVGGRLGYGVRRVGQQGPWEFPVGFEAAVLQTENPETGDEGTFSTFGGSAAAARRLGARPLYLQPGLQIAGGTEDVRGQTELFFGGRLGVDLVYYPEDTGVVAGLGVYGSRLFGSDFYPWDVGVTGTLGVQF